MNKLRPETLLKLFNAIDVWRKPERLEQMIMTSEADARGRTGFENNPYPQGDYLRAAFQIANGVSIQEVVASGLQGLAIRDELQRRRQQALAEWKQTQETASI
ncbi:tRNA nucleotidyltransferase [Yersinia pestis D106004]|nr:tRNA nucleotidyltransferase [Yersinia pestis D106004]